VPTLTHLTISDPRGAGYFLAPDGIKRGVNPSARRAALPWPVSVPRRSVDHVFLSQAVTRLLENGFRDVLGAAEYRPAGLVLRDCRNGGLQ